MTAIVIGTASHSDRPKRLTMDTQVSAAKNTMAPWAKLNTPDAL